MVPFAFLYAPQKVLWPRVSRDIYCKKLVWGLLCAVDPICTDSLRPWGGWGGGGQVRAVLVPDLVNAQAEIFLINGDMNSNLYTSSRAMHSSIIGLLQVC